MTDRYLFRGKRLDNGEWVYGALFKDDNDRFYIITGVNDKSHVSRGARSKNVSLHWVDPATVGQCIGIKAKGGRLIFEGDIDEVGGVFVYKNYCLGRQYRDTFYSMNELDLFRPFEIIGDIHDKEAHP